VTDSRISDYVQSLVAETGAQWSSAGGNATSFPSAASRALEGVELPAFSTADLLAHFATEATHRLPAQSELGDQFGQPPAILFRGPDFFIQGLTWMEGTTAIHQHGFCGAFKVADGQSLHVPYRFETAEQLAPELAVGDLRMETPEILDVGDVRIIEPGSAFIHALFHLARPSLTIVVRNYSSDVGTPQFNYRRPGLAYAPQDHDVLRQRRLQAVGALSSLDPEEGSAAARQMMASEDVWGAFQVIDHCFGLWGWNDRFTSVLEAFGTQHRVLAEPASAMYQELWRSDTVLRRRTLLHERHQRTFLALLANLPSRGAIESVLATLAPGRASDEVLMEWIDELASPQLRGVSGLSLSDEDRTALRAQLRGDSLTESLHSVSARFGRSSILDYLVTT
jgi:hypothetical protein